MVRMRERSMQQQTYANYLTWSATSGDELIDGVAYVGEPPAPSRLHQDFIVELCRQLATSLLEKPRRVHIARFDVRLPEAGAIDDDQIDTVRGQTALSAVPGVRIDWDRLLAVIGQSR